jgi:phospholipid/cholesterol/gamma-HCH transport system permease protein
MGVNSANSYSYQNLASVIFNPFLIAISMVFGIWGGHLAGIQEIGLSRLYFRNSNVYATILYGMHFQNSCICILIATIPAFLAIK